MAKKTPAQQALDVAQERAAAGADWIELNNAVFGIGSVAQRLFPTEAERIAFTKSPEFAEIMRILESAPDTENVKRPEVSGNFHLRLPRSLHAALVIEADAEGTSLNQLVVEKLARQLRAVV